MRCSHNKGIAIFLSLSLLFLLSVGAIVVLLTAYNYAYVTEKQISRSRAILLAESGIHYAYWKIRIGKYDNGDDISFPCILTPPILIPTGWSIQVDISGEDPTSGFKTIQSKVTY